MHKYVYTATQLSVVLLVFSWPITSLDPYSWDCRKPWTMVRYYFTYFSRVDHEFKVQTVIGQFNFSELCSDLSLTLRSSKWWRSTHIRLCWGYKPVAWMVHYCSATARCAVACTYKLWLGLLNYFRQSISLACKHRLGVLVLQRMSKGGFYQYEWFVNEVVSYISIIGVG